MDSYQAGSNNSDVIIIGNNDPRNLDTTIVESIFERVVRVQRLIVLENADFFADNG